MRRIVECCEAAGVRYRIVPGLGDLMAGKVSVKALRDVRYEDLLGRPPVELDVEGVAAYLKDKRVLVTGAGGSIGAELCRQVAAFKPETLILLDASEPSLYAIQMELKHRMGYLKYVTALGSMTNEKLVDNLFAQYRPHVVFHAAAYKHVPMLERNPWEAVRNNIRGTRLVMEAAVANGAERFLLVSTDKAVRPTSVMGASKRVCERIMVAMEGDGTRLMAVRFGNVLGSSGSVIPLFRDQIARGGPVTVTHPEVTRYFMTIPEACSLILEAAGMGTGGEIFVLEMGTPVKIADMARDLIRLSGKEPDREIKIAYTGLRAGEKLYEELITGGEDVVQTSHEKILVLQNDGDRRSPEELAMFRENLFAALEDLYIAADAYSSEEVLRKLEGVVPDFKPA
jgi:FlaA1/EpsC-like NDP-sugar epimerase